MYVAEQYWAKRKNPNNPSIDRTQEFEFIRRNAEGAKTIVDFGCGVGAISHLYPEDAKILGVDFVDTYRQQWLKATPNGKHKVMDIRKQPLFEKPKQVDLVVMSKVLLHAPFIDAYKYVRELSQYTNKMIVTTAVTDIKTLKAEHCFNHEYLELFKDFKFWDVEFKGSEIFYCIEC